MFLPPADAIAPDAADANARAPLTSRPPSLKDWAGMLGGEQRPQPGHRGPNRRRAAGSAPMVTKIAMRVTEKHIM